MFLNKKFVSNWIFEEINYWLFQLNNEGWEIFSCLFILYKEMQRMSTRNILSIFLDLNGLSNKEILCRKRILLDKKIGVLS